MIRVCVVFRSVGKALAFVESNPEYHLCCSSAKRRLFPHESVDDVLVVEEARAKDEDGFLYVTLEEIAIRE